MSYSTIGAILTGVGAFCQLVASGFTQQIEIIKVKTTFPQSIFKINSLVNIKPLVN
jgi:hypothetical protein